MVETCLFEAGREVGATAERLGALRQHLQELRDSAGELGPLLERCARYGEEARNLWNSFEASHPTGTPAALRGQFEGFLALLDERLRNLDQAKALAAELGPFGAQPPSLLAKLETAGVELRAQRERVARLWEWLSRPPVSPDRSAVERARGAFARGEFKDSLDLLGLLQTGATLDVE